MKNMLLKFIQKKFNYSLLFFLILISSLDGIAQNVIFTADITWPSYASENQFRVTGPSGSTAWICYPSNCYNGSGNANYTVTGIAVGSLTASCAANAFTITRQERYGDTWNGTGTVTLYANGVLVGTYGCTCSTAGCTQSSTFTLPSSIFTSGCNIGLESGPNFVAASGCSNGSLNLGPGAYYDITLAADTYYNFSWAENSGATTSGFCASITPTGSGATSNSFSAAQTNWYSGSVARTLRVSANRLCSVWSATSATLTYRHSDPTVGTPSNAGPINFCDAGGNFNAVTPGGVSVNFTPAIPAQHGKVIWDWGSSDGTWNTGWITTALSTTSPQASSGVAFFPKKINTSDANADRMRYRVTNNGCDVTSSTILIQNRYNEAPTSLAASTSSYCSGSGPANITLTATFPTAINKLGTVKFYSGSCGGTLLATVSASDNSTTAATTIAAPGATTTYYALYDPGTGNACSVSSCVSTTVTVNPNPTANAGGALAAICQGAQSAAMGGSVGGSATGGTWSGGAGSWTNATNPSTARYTAGVGESGSITLTLTTSGGSCGTTTATKNITVNVGPTANAGGALAAICQGAQSAAMGGSVGGSATGGTWSGGAGSWTNATNPSTARYTAGAGESGSITLTLTTSGGSCGTTTATKNITVNANPTANAGGALTSICQGATTQAMGGSVGGSATGGTWSGGSGSWTNANNPATATYTAAAGEGGTITLTLTTSGGSCGTTTATKNLTLPTVGTDISGTTSATCVVKDNNWVHFYDGSGLLIGAINSGGVDLGNVTMNVSVGGAGTMDACNETPVNPLYTTAYMGRAWVVTSSAYPGTDFPSSVQIRLPFNGSELTAMNSVATSTTTGNPNDNGATVGNIMLTKFTGGLENTTPSDNCSGGVTRGVAQSTNGVVTTTYPGLSAASGASYVEFVVGQFSEMYLHKNFTASPLPVQLIDFVASCEEGNVHLNWSTASEQNSQDFVVERSRDLNAWQEVEIVPAAGNSSQNRDYFSTDDEAFQGTSYYRLRQRDLNGDEEVFGPIAATCGSSTNSIQVFPNPTQGSFTVEIHSENSESGVGIQLTNMTGQVIETRSINLEAGTNQINFHNKLESGIYLIRVLDENRSFKTLKLEVRN